MKNKLDFVYIFNNSWNVYKSKKLIGYISNRGVNGRKRNKLTFMAESRCLPLEKNYLLQIYLFLENEENKNYGKKD